MSFENPTTTTVNHFETSPGENENASVWLKSLTPEQRNFLLDLSNRKNCNLESGWIDEELSLQETILPLVDECLRATTPEQKQAAEQIIVEAIG